MHQAHNISYSAYVKLFTDRANRYDITVRKHVHEKYEESDENIQKNITFLIKQFFSTISEFSDSFTKKINMAKIYTIEDFNSIIQNIITGLNGSIRYNCYSESIDYTPIENLIHDPGNQQIDYYNMEDMIYLLILSKDPKLINTFLTYIKKKYPSFDVSSYLRSHRYFNYGRGGIYDHLENLIHVYLFINILHTELSTPIYTIKEHIDTHNHKRSKKHKNIFAEQSFYVCDKFAPRNQNIVSDYIINQLYNSTTYKYGTKYGTVLNIHDYMYGSFNKEIKLSLNIIANIDHHILRQITKEIFEIIYITVALLNTENTFDIIKNIMLEYL